MFGGTSKYLSWLTLCKTLPPMALSHNYHPVTKQFPFFLPSALPITSQTLNAAIKTVDAMASTAQFAHTCAFSRANLRELSTLIANTAQFAHTCAFSRANLRELSTLKACEVYTWLLETACVEKSRRWQCDREKWHSINMSPSRKGIISCQLSVLPTESTFNLSSYQELPRSGVAL